MRTATDSPNVVEWASSLNRPTQDDVRYPREEWRQLLSCLSAEEALAARNRTDDGFLKDVFAGVALMRTGEREHLHTALGIRQQNDDSSIRRVENRALSTFEYLPLVTGCLLCGWIDHINVYERDYYNENVRNSIGYYHSEEHYIDIASDFSDTSRCWSRNRDYRERPEYSTTIHELGHAVQYMNGVQIRDSDTLNNNDRDSAVLNLRRGIERTDWQDSFLWDGVEGYYNLWQGRYDKLRSYSEYQKSTLGEFYAIAFEAWTTAPEHLFKEQPIAWRAFNRLD